MQAASVEKKATIYPPDEGIEDQQGLDDRFHSLVDSLNATFGVNYGLMLRSNRGKNCKICYLLQTAVESNNLLSLCRQIVKDYNYLLRQGKPLAFGDRDRLFPLWIKQSKQIVRIQSLLLIPLVYQKFYLGEIFLYSCENAHQWTSNELELIRNLADRCAMEIVQSQSAIQIRQQQFLMELLWQIAQTLNSNLNLETILSDILALVGKGLQCDRAIVFRLEENTSQIEREWRSSNKIPLLSTSNIPLWEESRICKFKQKGDIEQVVCQIDRQTGCFFNIPLMVRGSFFGSLTLQLSAKKEKFSSAEIRTIEFIAQQIAIAIGNIKTQKQLERLQECTENLEIEKQCSEEANRAKSEFLSHMNHELRTPLTGVLGFARMLRDEIYGTLNQKQQQYVNAIAASGEHLLSLVNDFLDISKIEANREELEWENLVVKDLCVASLAIVESRAYEQKLELLLEIEPDIGFCQGDSRRIKQILVNLLSNAIKFTEVGSVTLKVKQNEDKLEFCVIDTGIGIKECDRDKLFQPFQQIHNHLSRKHKGTGLGLTLSRQLAQLHGGDLTLVSDEGKGSCFTLHLPVAVDRLTV